MIWIDDVINDLKSFCDDHGYVDISAKLDEARIIYHLELQDKFCSEFSKDRKWQSNMRYPDKNSETIGEFKRNLRLVRSKN